MRHHLLILLYGVVLLLLFLDNGTVLSRHEVLAAEPAREMLETDTTWAVQSFADEFRTAKPPTMSWLIALCMKLFDSRSEFVCRLPAAISGIIAAHAIAIIASRLLDARAGLLAGLTTLTTFWLQMQARLAEADMLLTAAVTVAMLALVPRRATESAVRTVDESVRTADPTGSEKKQNQAGPSLLFYFATGIGFLLKGVAPLVTIPSAILFAIWMRDARLKRLLLNPFGIILFIVLLLAWPVWAYLTYPQIATDWYNQIVNRSAGQMQGHEQVTLQIYLQEFFFYFWTIPWILLPATPAVVIGWYASSGRWNISVASRFCISWVVPFLVLLTLSAFKHKHYALPILPAFSIVAAQGTLVWLKSQKNPRLGRGLLVLWFVGFAGVLLWVQWKVLPKFDTYRAHAELAWRANELLPADARVRLIGLGEAHIAYYLKNIPLRIDDPDQTPGESFYAVCAKQTLDSLSPAHAVQLLAEQTTLRGKEQPRDRLVLAKIN